MSPRPRPKLKVNRDNRIAEIQAIIIEWEARIKLLDWWLLGHRPSHPEWSAKASERNVLHTKVSMHMDKITRLRNGGKEYEQPNRYEANITVTQNPQ